MHVPNAVAGFVEDESGLELVEYAVMAALVVGGTVVAIGALLAALIAQTGDLVDLLMGG
jgi:hypothetical protein